MSSNLYDDSQSAGKRTKGEMAQIGVLSLIILVFFALAGNSAVSLIMGSFRH